MKKIRIYSVFLAEHFVEKDKYFKKSYQFYYGDLSKTILENDWRFKEVLNKRKEAVFMGLANTAFPINFPLKLENDKLLNK